MVCGWMGGAGRSREHLGALSFRVLGHMCGSRDSRREWAKSLSYPTAVGENPEGSSAQVGVVQTREILKEPSALQSSQQGRRQGDGEGWGWSGAGSAAPPASWNPLPLRSLVKPMWVSTLPCPIAVGGKSHIWLRSLSTPLLLPRAAPES